MLFKDNVALKKVQYCSTILFFFFSERMAVNIKDEIKMENIEIKEEIQENILPSYTVEETSPALIKDQICSIKDEEILQSSTVEDTCTVYIKEEDVKMENTKVKGNVWNIFRISEYSPTIYKVRNSIFFNLFYH